MSKKKCTKCSKLDYESYLNWCNKCSLKIEGTASAVYKVKYYMYCPKNHEMLSKYFDSRDR